MEVRAFARNIRVSPYKARLVASQIKKMPPAEAVKMLDFIQKLASKPLKKVIMSAIANAINNNNLDEQSLTFKEIQIGHGLAFKRYRPISRGRVHPIKKRTSNIRVVLEGGMKKTVAEGEPRPEGRATAEKTDKSHKTDTANKSNTAEIQGGGDGTKS